MGWSCNSHRQHLLHLATPVTRPDSAWFLPVAFHPTTSKNTARIARAHRHRNRERHTRQAWEGLAGMGVSSGHLPCHIMGAHRMHLRSLWNCKTFLFQMVVTSCISVQYLWKYGFAKSSDNLYAPCVMVLLWKDLYTFSILMKLEFSRRIFKKFSKTKFH